eukprot:Hpha_TRINITY_DN19523_c0_g1::TRINITY_DN19523_c0_g1_i1::g.33651::m.33651
MRGSISLLSCLLLTLPEPANSQRTNRCDAFSSQGFKTLQLKEERWWGKHPTRTISGRPTWWSGTSLLPYIFYWCSRGKHKDKWVISVGHDDLDAGGECPAVVAARFDGRDETFEGSGVWTEDAEHSLPDLVCGGMVLSTCGSAQCTDNITVWPQAYPLPTDGTRNCQPFTPCGADTNDRYILFSLPDVNRNVTVQLFRDPGCGAAETGASAIGCDVCLTISGEKQSPSCSALEGVRQAAISDMKTPAPEKSQETVVVVVVAVIVGVLVIVNLGVLVLQRRRKRVAEHTMRASPMLGSEMQSRQRVVDDLVKKLETFFAQADPRAPKAPNVQKLSQVASTQDYPEQYLFDKLRPYYAHREAGLRAALGLDQEEPRSRAGSKKSRVHRHSP